MRLGGTLNQPDSRNSPESSSDPRTDDEANRQMVECDIDSLLRQVAGYMQLSGPRGVSGDRE